MGEDGNACAWPNPMPLVCFMSCYAFNCAYHSTWAVLKFPILPLCCLTTDRLLYDISGIPNTLNVVSNFPFLVIGVIGLVLCYHGNYFRLR